MGTENLGAAAPQTAPVKPIYVVSGATGEYSDHRTWMVRAFTTESAAQREVTRLSELARVYEQKKSDVAEFWEIEYDNKRHAEFIASVGIDDPGFASDYTGTSYHYAAVQLVEAAP